MAFAVSFIAGRTSDDSITLYESDGITGIALSATDVVRVKVYGRNQSTPILDLDSAAATANGSVITVTQTASAATATLRVHQDDTVGLIPGAYRADICVVDDSDDDVIKSAEQGVAYILSSGGGSVGLS